MYESEVTRLILAIWAEQAAVLGLPGPDGEADAEADADAEAWLANQALPRAVVLAAARGDVAALAAVRQVAGLPLL